MLKLGILSLGVAGIALASDPSLEKQIEKDLSNLDTSQEFRSTLKRWSDRFDSPEAVFSLLRVAENTEKEEKHRYIALMAATKLGGKAAMQSALILLEDSSWMLRSAALHSLRAVSPQKAQEAAGKLLVDPALVVRMEALEVMAELDGASDEAIEKTLTFSSNYPNGKALWLPQKAIQLLTAREKITSDSRNRLRSVVDEIPDPQIAQQLQETL